jgi:hypothetical protein
MAITSLLFISISTAILIIRRRRKRRRGVITISNARIPFHFKHQLIEFAMEIFTLTISAQSLNILSQSNLLENATHTDTNWSIQLHSHQGGCKPKIPIQTLCITTIGSGSSFQASTFT